jgi:hypothetical protein
MIDALQSNYAIIRSDSNRKEYLKTVLPVPAAVTILEVMATNG